MKMCKICTCRFTSQADFDFHMNTHWRPTRRNPETAATLPAEGDPYLAQMLRFRGALVRDGFRYVLLNDTKIYRERVEVT